MTLRVAIVGSGPAGIYTADALTKQAGPDVEVDVLERLPTPYGLVRYGVAPDHTSIKSIARYLRQVLERPAVRFLGGVELGADVSAAARTGGAHFGSNRRIESAPRKRELLRAQSPPTLTGRSA